MCIQVRKNIFDADIRIDTRQIYAASRLVSQVTGLKIQPNKPIVGENAFSHESGIHQHGIMANAATYEIMDPQSIGIPRRRMVLGKHSGKHAFEDHIKGMGLTVDPKTLKTIFEQFKSLADKKKAVDDRDIEALVMGVSAAAPETWKLDHWAVNTGSALGASSTIRLHYKNGLSHKEVSMGDGPIDSIFKAINQIIGKDPDLEL
jgi:2-isopropylmalate synthase